MHPVILAGGSGNRLWPISNKNTPKQFIKMFRHEEYGFVSSFQLTLLLNKELGKPIIITNKFHCSFALQQTNEIGSGGTIIVEPSQKNTATCAILGALISSHLGAKDTILLPADHLIKDYNSYNSALCKAKKFTEQFGLCTIGIKPLYPHTGYGYIKTDTEIEPSVFLASSFVEKPPLPLSIEYCQSGNYFWNTGIFVYNNSFILDCFRQLMANTVHRLALVVNYSKIKNDLLVLPENSYDDLESISIDYAIIERLENMILIEGHFEWHDIGNWHSLWNMKPKDNNLNHINGQNILVEQVSNSYISSDNQFTAILGLDNVIVVSHEGSLLVASKEKAEDIKSVLERHVKQ